jgi:hypothetical protein
MEEVTNMIINNTAFREGDEVVLERGTYQGTLGVFVRLKIDVKWADITQRNGALWSHPVEWLAHAASAAPAVAN